MSQTAQTNRWILGLASLLVAGVFGADLLLPLGGVPGVLYVAPVLLTPWVHTPGYAFSMASATTFLTLVGFFLSRLSVPVWIGVTDRVLVLCAIWITAVLARTYKQAEEARERATTYLELLQTVASAANQAVSSDEALQSCLDRVCALTSWPVGHCYLGAPDAPGELVPTGLWHLDDPERFQTFRQITEATRLATGRGLPGRVLASGQPAWIVDVTQDPNFPRAQMAQELGVKAGFAFPVLIGQEVAGVLEFFSTEPVEPNAELLSVMVPIGTQLGRVIERQRAAEALRESELRFRSVAQSAPDAIIAADGQGTIIFWNQGAQALFGYGEDEAVGQVLTLVMPERYQEAHRHGLARLSATGEARLIGKTIELQGLKKDGQEFPVELSLARWQTGDRTFYSGIIRDLTTRKQAEAALRAARDELDQRVQERTAELVHTNAALQEEISARQQAEAALQQERDLLEVTLASIGDAVIATDSTATLTFINPVAETLTGWPAQDAMGRHITDVFHIINEQTRQAVENPVDSVIREGNVVGLANHTVLIARDGREVPIADSGAPIRSKSGQVYGTVMVFRDITESKRAEGALRQAREAAERADRIKSEFLTTMSHELRTPLNVILGYTDMLIDGGFGDLPAAQVEILRRIDRNSRVLFELISMVLDLNRLEAGRLPVDVKEVRVAELLAEIKVEMQGLCDQSGLAVVWQVAVRLPSLHTDPGKLKVVLKNLLSNAVKFTKEGGITVDAQEQQGGVEISVSDTGIGIPAEAQALIFEPFRQVDNSDTRPYSGSGLGLHIVQRLLKLLGGTVTVESEVGRGSTFRVWLPADQSPTAP